MKKQLLSLLAIVILTMATSCQKDEEGITEEANQTIDLNLANQTDWKMAMDILTLINDHRATLDLAPIKKGQNISSAYAVDHTQYMIEKAQISHDNFGVRASALKQQGAETVAENVAYGYSTAEDVVNAWLNSPGHKSIIEGNFTHSGFGIISSPENRMYFTQLFYRK